MKVIIDLAGGFGNQLFCYCFGYSLAKENNAQLVIDTSSQDNGIARELELLNLNVEYDSRITCIYKKNFLNRVLVNKIRKRLAIGILTRIINEKKPTVYDPGVLEIKGDTYFKGYWQSEKYFKSHRDALVKLLTPKEKEKPDLSAIYKEVNECNSVALHVRRGDYVDIGCQLDMDYYDIAITKMRAMFSEGQIAIYVFSDDIAFCRNYFSRKEEFLNQDIVFRYVQYESSNYTLDDLLIMSKCKNMIMANSSYSWWAAWLNQHEDKVVICPKLGIWKGDFYPEEWIKINCESSLNQAVFQSQI